MMNRRGFLGSILAACAAPAIVRADSLMRTVPDETLILPSLNTPAWLSAVREIRQYEITRDAFITRWDVAGLVNGAWTQFNASAYADYGGPLCLGSREGPLIPVKWGNRQYPDARELERQRDEGVAMLRRMVEDQGMLVVSRKLPLPMGVHHARFLG